MASWWRRIAEELGAENASTGSWARRVAVYLGADQTSGNSWPEKIARFYGQTTDVGSWARRMVDPSDPGSVGSWPSRIFETGALTTPAAAPVNTVAPQISGSTVAGQTLSATTGTWDNEPTQYAYQWNAGGAPISGATASTYVLTSDEVGDSITVTVTATNDTGSTSHTSASVGPVTAVAAPTFVASGSLGEGSQASSISVGYPAGLQANDILLLAVQTSETGSNINTPGGWSDVANEVEANSLSLKLMWKRATGAESGTLSVSQTSPGASAKPIMGVMTAWRGVPSGLAAPFAQADSATGSGTVLTAPGLTTIKHNARVINVFAIYDNLLSSPSAGWTERYDASTAFGIDAAQALTEKAVTTPGTPSGQDTRGLGESEPWVAFTVELTANA